MVNVNIPTCCLPIIDTVFQTILEIPAPPPDLIADGDYVKIMNVEKKSTTDGKKEGITDL